MPLKLAIFWRSIWDTELRRIRSKIPDFSDHLGLVWYRDRAQLILYTTPPDRPLQAFAVKHALRSHRLVFQRQGLVAWAIRHHHTTYWVAARETESDGMGARFLPDWWPHTDPYVDPYPTFSLDESAWQDDMCAPCDPRDEPVRPTPLEDFWAFRPDSGLVPDCWPR